jgi:uncharacterized cupredoxin-like copper-binding protein
LALGLLVALVAGAFAVGARGLAQEEAGGRPAHIHAGNCNDLGDVVLPLNNLTAPAGDRVGQRRAVVAETSFTNVPATLETILAEDHAINLHLSDQEIGTYIACGEIGGIPDANGALVIGLKEQTGSGFTGVAYLAPGADGASTDVSVFIASERAAREQEAEGTPTAEEVDEETPVADEVGEDTGLVDVSLSEWTIDMPTSIPAGPTTFNITNNGTVAHNFEIEGNGVEESLATNLAPGESGTLELVLEAGTYEVYCPVGEGSHRQQGMELELTVE